MIWVYCFIVRNSDNLSTSAQVEEVVVGYSSRSLPHYLLKFGIRQSEDLSMPCLPTILSHWPDIAEFLAEFEYGRYHYYLTDKDDLINCEIAG